MPGRLRFVTSETGIWLQPSDRIWFGVGTPCAFVNRPLRRQDIQRRSILFRGRREAFLAQGAKRKSEPVGDDRYDDANPGHLQT
jgi:hypothetical protein